MTVLSGINVMKLIRILLLIIPGFLYSQNDTIITKKNYRVKYSQKYKQPIWVEYGVKTKECNTTRKGMTFYPEKGVITSNDIDYDNNIYDKGHMVPAADFCHDKFLMHLTFSYLNCALQHYHLNRGVWKELEELEREYGKKDSLIIKIDILFNNKTNKSKGNSLIPSGFRKTIIFYSTKKKLIYEFPNIEPNKPLNFYLKK
jgi:endonuclease G